MEIRRAEGADAPTVADIYLRSRAGAGPAFPPGVHPDHETQEFVRDVVVPTRETWLGCLDGRPAGVLVLDGDDVHWLFVLPAEQGLGVGGALLAHAKSRRPNGLALWVFASNAPARAFYEAHAFVAVRTTDGADNEERAPDVRYVWGAHPERLSG